MGKTGPAENAGEGARARGARREGGRAFGGERTRTEKMRGHSAGRRDRARREGGRKARARREGWRGGGGRATVAQVPSTWVADGAVAATITPKTAGGGRRNGGDSANPETANAIGQTDWPACASRNASPCRSLNERRRRPARRPRAPWLVRAQCSQLLSGARNAVGFPPNSRFHLRPAPDRPWGGPRSARPTRPCSP